MRLDLHADINVERSYALINVQSQAQMRRDALLHPSARADLVAAYHEVVSAPESSEPGAWVRAEQTAHQAVGLPSTKASAELAIRNRYHAWAAKAAQVGAVVREAELRLEAAQSVREIQQVMNGLKWPGV